MACIDGDNYLKKTINVRHADLKRYDAKSYWKRCCPVCKVGLLPVTRKLSTLGIVRYDNCLNCGQRVRYTDVEEMRERERRKV